MSCLLPLESALVNRFRLAIFVLAFAASSSCCLQAQDNSDPTVDFNRDIRPILAKHCYSCHGPDKGESGLRLNAFDTATAAMDSGAFAIVPQQAAESELLKRVASDSESDRMPPEGKPLTDREIDLLSRWIQEGAVYTQHWSFQAIRDVAIPTVSNTTWAKNPIDLFLLAKLEKNKLQPARPADPRQLARRLYVNILGVPPTTEEIERFVANSSENSYQQLVDQLLADPRMGERWARHWLDLVRYAETNSFERDGAKPNAWKYRDYVIRAMNSDKPYDRFLKEQIAGDEIPDADVESKTATGFYRLGIWDDEPADKQLALFEEFDDIVSTTSQAVMALTVNCARCHDHKIDPITQKDYYQLVAMVRDVNSYGRNNQVDLTPPDLEAQYNSLTTEHQKLEAEIHEIEQRGIVKMSAEDQRATEGGGRGKVLKEKLKDNLSADDWKLLNQKKDAVRENRQKFKNLPERESLLGLARCESKPGETFVLQRGNPGSPGAAVEPDFPSLFGAKKPVFPAVADGAKSAGRRQVFADWLVSDENWMTARVIVNRLWQHHFGRGIVRSPNNFGQLGEIPTHPELLDWLAKELIRNNWQLKPIHRLIVTSNAYRMSSHMDALEPSIAEKAQQSDPNNDYFWRFNPRRLSAEELRDTVLATSGALNLQKHGPSIYPKISEDVKATQSVPGAGWQDCPDDQRARRSVYIHIKRSLIPPELANFDFPETDSSCEARFLTTQPAQALNLLNGQFMQEQSKTFAERVMREQPGPWEARWKFAVQQAWGRPATNKDIESAKKLTEVLRTKHKLSDDQAFVYYCLVLLNSNEFLYLD